MEIAVGSDERTPWTKAVVRDLESRGMSVELLGAPAEGMTQDGEKARVDSYRKVFKVVPNDPFLCHMVLNMENLDFTAASSIIAHAAICYGQGDRLAT